MPDLPTSHPKQFYQGAPLLLVPDVTTTAEFYRRILGFTSDPDTATTEYSVVWRDNAAVHLTRGEHAPTGGVHLSIYWYKLHYLGWTRNATAGDGKNAKE